MADDNDGLDTEIEDESQSPGGGGGDDEEGGDEPSEVEIEVQGLLDEMEANLARTETHASLPRGVRLVAAGLVQVAKRLAEEFAYETNLDGLPDDDGAAGVAGALTQDQQMALAGLTEMWLGWLPHLVAMGNPDILRLADDIGGSIDAVLRTMLPSMGIPAERVDEMMAEARPLVPARPSNGIGAQPGSPA